MRLLLDTHTFLWYVSADPLLPARHRAAITDPANRVYLSIASVWEAVIKYHLNKLPLPAPAEFYMREKRRLHRVVSVPINDGAMPRLAGLPPLHRDPFDRIIVAQALQYGLTVVTVDAAVIAYPVPTLPAV